MPDADPPIGERFVSAAAIQITASTGDKERNLCCALEAVHRACEEGARLVVLPELGTSGYAFSSRDEVEELAEPIGGLTTRRLLEAARDHGAYICAGFPEVDGSRLYNSALLVGPDGLAGHYRKLHLWDRERLLFDPGNLGLDVVHLPFARVGIMMCYDGWHPEVPRLLKLKGADIILDPSCWTELPNLVAPNLPLAAYVRLVTAHVNNLYVVCADQCGVDRDSTFLGQSCIAGPSGFVAGPCGRHHSEVLVAELDLWKARDHQWTALSNPFADRRTDLFDEFLGYRAPGRSNMVSGRSEDT